MKIKWTNEDYTKARKKRNRRRNNRQIGIGTWSVNTLLKSGKLEEEAKELEIYQIYITGYKKTKEATVAMVEDEKGIGRYVFMIKEAGKKR